MGCLSTQLVVALALLLTGPSVSQRRGRLGTGTPVDFDCPEEFGYYPHPGDCTQYYVCVFGGALLESCTGGLMYSHELQTCDWPRNVGCGGEGGESATISTVRVTDPRTRQPTTPTGPSRSPPLSSRGQSDQQQRQQQEEIAKHQLYADDLGPAEEIESDRQQRVYRGQPSTLGQVARDRDGLRHSPVTNAIPSPAGRVSAGDKIAVISFGSQQPPQNTQYSLDLLTQDNSLTNETTNRRKKRQVRFRYPPARVVQIVPTGVRVSASPGNGGNFKYQANVNRNKPSRLNDPMSPSDSGFQPLLPHPDARHFRSPDQYTNANTKFSGHQPPPPPPPPPPPDLNFDFRPVLKAQVPNRGNNLQLGSSPSSFTNYQQLAAPDLLHFHLQPSSLLNLTINNPQVAAGDGSFSYFNLGQFSPTTSQVPIFSTAPATPNLLTTLKTDHTTPRSANINQHLLRALTSVHELPYNEDGTRLYQVSPQHQQETQLYPALKNIKLSPQNHSKPSSTEAPFRPNTSPYGDDYIVNRTPHRFERPQVEYDDKGTHHKFSRTKESAKDYSSEEDYYDESNEDHYENSKKYKNLENPFADINFDFDKYISKLKGDYEGTNVRATDNARRPDYYEDYDSSEYDDDYDDFEEGLRKGKEPAVSIKQQYSELPVAKQHQQTERNSEIKITTERNVFPTKDRPEIIQKPDTLTAPFYHGSDGNYYVKTTHSTSTQNYNYPSSKQTSTQGKSPAIEISKGVIIDFQTNIPIVPANPTDQTTRFRGRPENSPTVSTERSHYYTTEEPYVSTLAVHLVPDRNAFSSTAKDITDQYTPTVPNVNWGANYYWEDLPATPQYSDYESKNRSALFSKTTEYAVNTDKSKSNYHLNNNTYNQDANIFSSVKDTISLMSNLTQAPDSASTPPYETYTQTSPEVYTIRRRPPKDQTTTPRYRGRRPITRTTTPSDTVGSSTSPTPPRRLRRPITKRTTTTTTTTTEAPQKHDRDGNKEASSNRQNKKYSATLEDNHATNNIRVEPSVAPAYVQQPVQQVSPSPSAYNSSQQYEPAQYDQYYSLYDEDVELYRDVDYSQYTGNQGQTGGTSNNNNNNNNQQYRGPSPYKQAPQQPTVYAQPSYNTQDVYSQAVNAQDYNENYNTQAVDDQYRQQLAARKPTAAPTRSNRNELNISHESTSTTIPSTTTTTSTTTSTVAPARQQTRQRGEAATTPQTTRTTQANIPEEFQTLWNLPSQNSDSRPTPSPRQTSEQKPAPRRVTLTAALSLDEPFAPDTKTSRNQGNSRRVSLTSNDSGSRRGTSEVVPVTSSRSSQNSRSQNTPRRVSGKSFAVADIPNSRASARGSDVITIEDIEPTRFTASASESDSSVRKVASTPSRGRTDSNSQVDIISVARSSQRSAKLVSNSAPSQEVEFARQPSFKASVDSNDFSDSDSDTLTSSRSLSRNSIAQLESTTTRSRARGNKQTSCNDEVETNSNTGCTEKPQLRVRPTTASPDSQTTPVPARGAVRNRGSASYTAADETVNRGTPASVRSRPTLKPSTAIVSKAQEFIDIYKYPPRRPDPVYPQPTPDKTAAKCRKDVCLLPDCNCGGKDIPGDFTPEEIPQLVLLTFDDSANDLNKGLYSDLFEKGRKNPNGCPIGATFYVSHEWTDYSHVQNLYSAGHEIASHSISHSFGEQFSQKKWTREIGGQREILAAYGGVKLEDVRGMRAPFLAVGGNKMFKMLYDSNFTYDSSMPVYENRPPSWPYTLDYKIFHDCMIPPCPTRSYPGVWEVPMVMWQDLNGGRCSMGDACSNPPTADGVYKMLIKNFERHYTTNRAPFGLFYHAAWFTQPHHKEGFIAFLDTIVNMQDVWLVTNWQAIQWVRDPTPLSRINNFQPFQCNYADRPKRCNNPKVCNLWHKSGVRYMRTCQPCPDIYPWTGKTGVRNSRVDNEVFEE